MPNGLTLFNLFCGIYAIILATQQKFSAAPSFIVLGGIADTLDGRVARATGTGSRFGEELDSLVDAISFGFAPALIVYLGVLNRGPWEWLIVFIFTSCAVMRLARFNVEQAGRKKTHFHGLPSPAAGLTLATYYWFAQTPLYNQTVILFTDSKTLSDLPWSAILRGLMAVLAALMISDVPYPTVPSIGFSSIRRIAGTLVIAATVVLLLVRREEFIFPALLAYVLFGVVKWAILGLLGRSSTPDEVFGTTGGLGVVGARPPDGRRPSGARLTPAIAQPAVEAPREERVREERVREERAREERVRDERVREDRRRDGSEPSDERRTPDGQPQRRKRRRRRGGGGGGGRPPGSNPPGPTLPDLPTGQAE
jgi:CDP-diacylglycerol--serine O-phosphatidyltransferase